MCYDHHLLSFPFNVFLKLKTNYFVLKHTKFNIGSFTKCSLYQFEIIFLVVVLESIDTHFYNITFFIGYCSMTFFLFHTNQYLKHIFVTYINYNSNKIMTINIAYYLNIALKVLNPQVKHSTQCTQSTSQT